jgi:hypothetical protein
MVSEIALPASLTSAGWVGLVEMTGAHGAPAAPSCGPSAGSESLAGASIQVAALWVDEEKATADFTAKHGINFPLGHSADARAIARLTRAFANEDSLYLQSTGFVLDPQGKVIVSVYSSGAIGRFVPEDVTALVRHVREHTTRVDTN